MTLTVTDTSGLSTSCDATVGVVDSTLPAINPDASNNTVECDGAGNTAQLNA